MYEERFMKEAIKEAEIAMSQNEVPVGAVIVKDGVIIGRGHNLKEQRKLCTAHAEIVAIEDASSTLGQWYLDGCEMYVTMEPCAMCAGALINSRIEHLYYGTPDLRFGACGTLYNLPVDERFNHRLTVEGGLMREECLALLQTFFRALRKSGGRKKKEQCACGQADHACAHDHATEAQTDGCTNEHKEN